MQKLRFNRKIKYVILKYFVTCPLITDVTNVVYEKCNLVDTLDDELKFSLVKTITRAEAKELIKQDELEIVCENEFGTIWR